MYVLRLTISDTQLAGYDECTVVVIDEPAGEAPFGGVPWPIPGKIEAENYDLGGEGVAYHDTSGGNTGGGYRTDDVDIRTTSDVGGGYLVKDIYPGEWLNYTINVSQAGSYIISIRTAGMDGPYSAHFELDGSPLTGQLYLPNSGSWDNGVMTAAPACTLPAGIHILRLYFDNGDFNVNWFQIDANFTLTNRPPTVTLPASITAAMPGAAAAGGVALNGSVSDDGTGSLTITWSVLSAPVNGSVTFTNANAASTTASFNRIGTYTLQLDANDGSAHANSTVMVTVKQDGRVDFDSSGCVDGMDFLIWQRNYNHGTAASGAAIVDANFADANYARTHGDANGDGKVDGSDFLNWQQGYTFEH